MGNVREVWKSGSPAQTVQRMQYYPSGLPWADCMGADYQNRKYNGKELDRMHGLDLFDYGARHYDAAIGRWMSIDPLAEKYYSISNYNYCANNPVMYIDPTGEFPVETIWDIGNVLYDVGAAVYNHIKGDHKTARSHWGNAAFDAGAMLIPYVPAGTSKVVKAARAGDKVVDAVQAGKAARVTENAAKGKVFEKQVGKKGKSAYDIAKAGGKHSGFLKNYSGRSVDEINKAINTLQTGKRGINTHLDKIANPSKYVPNWNTLSSKHQQSLINGWQKEITNGTEQIQILRGILGK